MGASVPKGPSAQEQNAAAMDMANKNAKQQKIQQDKNAYYGKLDTAQKAQSTLQQWEDYMNNREGVARNQVSQDLTAKGMQQSDIDRLFGLQSGQIKAQTTNPWTQSLKGTNFNEITATPMKTVMKGTGKKRHAVQVIDTKAANAMLARVPNLNAADRKKFLSGQGLNKYLLDPTANSGINSLYDPNNINQLGDPASLYDPNNLENAISSRYEQEQRQQMKGQLGNYRADLTNTFNPTLDDGIINNILDTEYGKAQKALDIQRQQGTLNGIGYEGALANLNKQKGEASVRLNQTGQDLLTSWQTELGNSYDNLANQANSFTLGSQAPDISGTLASINAKKKGYLDNLQSNLTSKLGNGPVFDTTLAMQQGGSQQGIIDPLKGTSTAPNVSGAPGDGSALQDAIQKRNKYLSMNRGMGSGASF